MTTTQELGRVESEDFMNNTTQQKIILKIKSAVASSPNTSICDLQNLLTECATILSKIYTKSEIRSAAIIVFWQLSLPFYLLKIFSGVK